MNFLGSYKYVVDFLVIAALVGLAAVGIHKYNAYQQDIGEARIQSRWDAETLARQQAQAKAIADEAAKTKALQTAIDTQRSQANAQINALNTSLASAIAGLRERPARPGAGDLPQHPGPGEGCTGAGLYLPDAEFLAREAARAKQLQIRLNQCYAAYDTARKALSP